MPLIFRLVAVPLFICASTALAANDAEIALGKRLAEENCAVCHAVTEEGASPHPAAVPFRELSGRYPIDSLEEALAEGIVTGHPFMPEFELEPEEVTAFLAYLSSIQQGDAAKQ
ncbi:cytochrome c [Stappia sp. F7233]|uniref:Cytochrome c n=1 Tax=Stappia albiluteola TaxID=2758565 RepID=A0A839AD12_9HYPH|nr:cytochrome c [Stappia albiluteola]MBA5777650.1 cytochrome c [Stappia albiluteola]